MGAEEVEGVRVDVRPDAVLHRAARVRVRADLLRYKMFFIKCKMLEYNGGQTLRRTDLLHC